MPTRISTLLLGILYLCFGICGCIPSLVFRPPPRLIYYDMTILGRFGFLFGWLPVNPVHNILYIILGGGAIVGAISQVTATWCARGLFFIMFMLTVTGLLPLGAAQLWGLIPLFAWNVMLHSVTAMLLYYYGFIYPVDLGGRAPVSQIQMPQGRL